MNREQSEPKEHHQTWLAIARTVWSHSCLRRSDNMWEGCAKRIVLIIFMMFASVAHANLICPTGQRFVETATGFECGPCAAAPANAQHAPWPAGHVPQLTCVGTVCSFAANECPFVCNPGHFLDGAVCSPCAAGTFKAVAGNQACTWCPGSSGNSLGGFQPDTGQTSCIPCPPNDWMTQYFAGYWSNSGGDGRHVLLSSCRTSWSGIQLSTGTFDLNCAHAGAHGGTGYGDFGKYGARGFCWPTSATCNPGYRSVIAGTFRILNRYDLEHVCQPMACDAGITRLRIGNLTIPLDSHKMSPRAIHVQTAGGICYAQLAPGQRAGALNVNIGGTVHHSAERCNVILHEGWMSLLLCPWAL
jgi:hypothetical protein